MQISPSVSQTDRHTSSEPFVRPDHGAKLHGAKLEPFVTRIFVGNFPYKTTEHDLVQLFGPYGPLEKVEIMMRDGQPRGFGFVEMEGTMARAAMEELHGAVFGGRKLEVVIARPKTER